MLWIHIGIDHYSGLGWSFTFISSVHTWFSFYIVQRLNFVGEAVTFKYMTCERIREHIQLIFREKNSNVFSVVLLVTHKFSENYTQRKHF